MKNKKLFSAILAGFLALVLTLGLVAGVLPQFVEGASLSELQKQLDELKDQKKDIDKKIKDLKGQLKDNLNDMEAIVKQKNTIDQEIFMLHEQQENLNTQISTYVLLIADKQAELDEANARLADLNAKNKERIRAMEENGAVSYWSVLFKANSFADLLDRLNMVEQIAAADQRRLKQMREASQKVEEAKAVLETERAALEVSRAELVETEAVLEERRAEADKLLAELIAIGEEYEKLLDDAEEKVKDLKDDIADAQDAYDEEEYRQWLATSKPGGTVTGGGGASNTVNGVTWIVPCKYKRVSSAYGWRIHPVYGYKKFHYGIDLAANKGTPIVASRSGKVIKATYDDSAGYYVTIDHGDGFETRYLHMTHYIVKKGDYVSAGQVIGYVGSTGASTGPHLHFGMKYKGEHVNPANYIKV